MRWKNWHSNITERSGKNTRKISVSSAALLRHYNGLCNGTDEEDVEEETVNRSNNLPMA